MPAPDPYQAPPFNPDDLVHRRVVENHRVELKASWNDEIKAATVRTVCAFANDLLNLNGGYVVLGVEERGGRPVLPPCGLGEMDLERIQKEIYGACKLIEPEYQPILFPVELEGRPILIIWAPGGDLRPYQAPENLHRKGSPRYHYVRQGPQTVRARGEFLNQLLAFAAKIPFDDRRSLTGRVEDVSPTLVRRFLYRVGSELAREEAPVDDRELYRKLRLVAAVNAHEVPRNVALLFFNEQPERFFPGAQIDVVRFAEAGGDLIDEQLFTGPLSHQLESALGYLRNLNGRLIRKVPDQAEAEHSTAWPFVAVEEALVNGVYHRAYDGDPEPLKVYVYPDRMEITSYPGPSAGLEREHFLPGAVTPAVPRRNRRIGEFLKELRLAEARSTGIRKIHAAMQRNGSPEARFDFDDGRTWFRVLLPIHHDHSGDPSSTR
jgi:ATP-dependent DNA helicase RecG